MVVGLNWNSHVRDFQRALDADQAERRAMLDSSAALEAGLEDERISGAIDDALVLPGNSWEERQEIIEEMSGEVADEIDRRKTILGTAYPFDTPSNSLVYRKSATGIYELCLAASGNPTGKKRNSFSASTIFEYIARDILVSFFGPGTEAFRVGWPAYKSENRGSNPKEFFEALNARCKEFRWDPQHDHPQDPPPKLLKDAGLDVVAWKPWPDKRNAQFFAVTQCACGKNDLDVKGLDACIERLEIWLRPISHAKPIKCLFVAHHLPNEPWLYALSKTAGLVFDRSRIALLAEKHPKAMASGEGIDYHAMASYFATP